MRTRIAGASGVEPISVMLYMTGFESGHGVTLTDVDGNEFIDYMCAYGPMVLGYNHPKVDAAAQKQLKSGNCITSPAPIMVELAEYLVDLISIADWAFFAKNGGDVTSYAIMTARAATGRKKIVLVHGGSHETDVISAQLSEAS